jgi:hypothetical protein
MSAVILTVPDTVAPLAGALSVTAVVAAAFGATLVLWAAAAVRDVVNIAMKKRTMKRYRKPRAESTNDLIGNRPPY